MERDKTHAQGLQLVKRPHQISQRPAPSIEPPDHNGIDVSTPCGMARSGDVYLPESRRHVSFTNLVYDPTRWSHERDLAYTELHLPQAPGDFVAHLQRAFHEVAQQAEQGLPRNTFATIRQDGLHLKQRDALALPPRLINSVAPLKVHSRWCASKIC